jgi:putative methyltransferase (TIGR04325 family)
MIQFLRRSGQPITTERILRSVQRRILDRLYPGNSFLGVYKDFAEAARAAPRVKPLGYDLAGSEGWYQHKLTDVLLEDYPVLFWLRSAFLDSGSLFEIGGHIGEAFYAFARVLSYPPELLWTIFDVPTINAKGAALARERGKTNLRFVQRTDQVDGADIIFAAGALQYIDSPTLAETVSSFRIKPKHILLNSTPVYDGPACVTLQNIGRVYCPYRIFNRQELIKSLDDIGYSLIDAWKKERAFRIRWHPERSFDHYSGFYFRCR